MSAGAPSTFVVYPAIDLLGGMVVRLRQGDFNRQDVYSDDPVAVASGFAASGSSWIHVVDLDGARDGRPRQVDAVRAILRALGATPGRPLLQAAGGLRTQASIGSLLEAGVARVVLGTAALGDPMVVRDAIKRFGSLRIAVALDVRGDVAVGEGWVPSAAGVHVDEALDRLTAAGVATFVVTAIVRDGLLGGPDLELLARCVRATGSAVIASGGIASIADLDAVRQIGCRGAIVGRALYDGTLDPADVFAPSNATAG